MSVVRWRQFTPLFFYSAVALCLVFLSAGRGLSALAILSLLLSGVMSWSLMEYGLHRFIFHFEAQSSFGRQLLHQVHLAHHENPEATQLFASLYLSLPIATVYFLLAWAITRSLAFTSYLFMGMAAGYFFYEWLHFHFHHRKSRLRIMKYLRRYHLLHHYKTPKRRFGVTSPLFDLVFGTFDRM